MAPSGRPRGRPRKYADIATAKEADRVRARQRWHQPSQSQSSRQPEPEPKPEPIPEPTPNLTSEAGPELLGLEALSLNDSPQPSSRPFPSSPVPSLPSLQPAESISNHCYPLWTNNGGSSQLEAFSHAKGHRVLQDDGYLSDDRGPVGNRVPTAGRASPHNGPTSTASNPDLGTPSFNDSNNVVDNDDLRSSPPNNERNLIPPLIEEQQHRTVLDSTPPLEAPMHGDNSPRDAAPHPIPQSNTPAGSPHPSVGEVPNPFATIVHDLVTEFQMPHACSRPEHALELRKHLHKVQNHRFTRSQCSSLSDLRNIVDPTAAGNDYIPHLLSRPDIHLNGHCEGLPSYDLSPAPAEPADFTGLPSDARFRPLFEGRDEASTRPYNACLHLHERSRLSRPAVFSTDIDSVCGFAESLAFCREGIDWFPSPHRTSNITNNLHGVYMTVHPNVGSDVDDDVSSARSPDGLRKISDTHQIALGRVFGGLRIDVFVLFPNLYHHRDRTAEPMSNFLTNEEECLWTDGVFLPSLIQFLPSTLFTEVPGSWRAAAANSLASSSEQARTKAISRQQLLSNFIPSAYCDLVWQQCIERINENPEFARFRGCRLFFNGKGFKSHTSCSTYTTLNARWLRLWSSCINEDHLVDSEWWLDLGRQYGPVDKSLTADPIDRAQHEAEIYLSKTCCIKGMYQKRTESCPRSHLRMDIYYHATLRDTCAATFTPSIKSREFRLGRVYGQVYSKSKVNFVTSATETLAEPAMETLALDPDYVKSVGHVGGAVSVSLQTQKHVYIRSKNHAHQSLLNAVRLPFGVRYEERLQARLWKVVLGRLVAAERAPPAAADGAAPELPYYIVPSETFFGLLRGQINKFCLGFEYTLWNCSPRHTRWEQTQAAIVFLRALRHSFGTSPIQQESLLWKDSWMREARFQPRGGRPRDGLADRRPSQHEGLAMSVAVQRCGIGWFASKFDWATWELKMEHVTNVLLENPRMLAHYQRRRGAIEDIQGVYIRLQQVGRWLARYGHDDQMVVCILDCLLYMCLRQFRADVYKILARDGAIKESAVEDATAGRLPLCWQTLHSVLTDGEPWFVGGNKSDVKDPAILVEYLFDQGPFYIYRGASKKAKDRLHWDNLPYRSLFHKSIGLVRERFGAQAASNFQRWLKKAILILSTVLPYPDYNTFFSRTKARAGRGDDVEVKTRRCWMAVWLYPGIDTTQLRAVRSGWNGYLIQDIVAALPHGARFVAGGSQEDGAEIDDDLPPPVFFDTNWESWLSDDGIGAYHQRLQRRRQRRQQRQQNQEQA